MQTSAFIWLKTIEECLSGAFLILLGIYSRYETSSNEKKLQGWHIWKEGKTLKSTNMLLLGRPYHRMCKDKREAIVSGRMTKSTKRQTMQRWNYAKTLQQFLITQRLRTDFGRWVGETTATQLVWLNRFTSAQPSLPTNCNIHVKRTYN